MAPKTKVIAKKETIKLARCNRNSGMGRNEPNNLPISAIQVLHKSEPSRRTPAPNTKAKENNRSFAKLQQLSAMPPMLGDGTCQIVFNASESSVTTEDAPKSKVNRLRIVATTPVAGF